MRYKIDPDVLARVAKQVVDVPVEDSEQINRTTELLSAEYPDLIAPTPGRWVGNRAGGLVGKVKFLYFSANEYIVLFGTPTGTEGFSGRYNRVDIHKFLLAGRIESYDLESDQTTPTVLLPGGRQSLERGQIRGFNIRPGSFHIEYGRGAVLTTVPFGMVETVFSSLDLGSVGRSTVEFAKLASGRLRSVRQARTGS
jgi:hypothetical protein